MLQFRTLPASGLRASNARPAQRIVVARAEQNSTSSMTSTQAPKVESTLYTLDALLGTPAEPAKPAAFSSPAPPAAPASPAPAAPSFNWPSAAPGGGSKDVRNAQEGFESVMGFEGLAPEVINGRAAMLGFIFAIGGEIGNGQSVFSQIVSGGGGEALFVILVVTLASFAPALRKISFAEMFGQDKKKPAPVFGPFDRNAELINGRAAMIGLAALFLLEGASNSAFFL